MKAMIFAAGLGTRLRPLTNDKPKALVEVNGVTMLEIAVKKLKNAGVDQLIVNLHHFGEKIREFLTGKRFFDMDIRFSDEKDLLLDTGGGLKKASWFFDDGLPFFLYNVDILTDLDLSRLLDFHKKHNPLATLAIKSRPGSRFFVWDKNYTLCGWKNFQTGEEKQSRDEFARATPFAFSGIHVIDPAIFDLMEEKGAFSIVDAYVRLAAKHPIKGFLHDDGYWQDLGKPENLKKGEEAVKKWGWDRFL